MSDPQALHVELLARVDESRSTEMKGAYSVGAGPAIDALRAVLELHKPQDIYPSGGPTGRPLCFGCDFDGYDAEHPEWPCQTVRVIAAALGVSADV